MGLFRHKVKEIEKHVASQQATIDASNAQDVDNSQKTGLFGDAQAPFSLPDLPPISPDVQAPVDSMTQNLEPTIPTSLPQTPLTQSHADSELPELPELPQFENHPEIADLAELPDEEMLPDSTEVTESEGELPQLEEDFSPAKPHDPNQPLFLDVQIYQDVLSDLSIAKSDLKHIHELSAVTEHEKSVDDALGEFKTNILAAKKQLNHIDEVLFTR